uniref:Adhesion G protein-coupled receptor G4b n=1 Tax=Cyprinus carpio TaxID=7962 RepID=A0A8C1K8C2_CYPCA
SLPNMKLNSYVVSASVTNATVSNLEIPVMVTLRQNKEVCMDPINHHQNKPQISSTSLLPHYTTVNDTGCETVKSNATHTTCSCDHLTHFGVLLVSAVYERILTIISYLGCGISSIFLGLFIDSFARKLRQDYPSKILINLSVALLGLNMLFLVNSWLASFNSNAICITVAAFLHYFFLATFTWMGLGAINMYLALVKVFNSYVPSYILKFCSFGWGLPLLVVSLVLAIDINSYGTNLSRNDVTFYVTVVSSVTLVMVCNICVFAVVLVQIHKMWANKPSSSQKGFLHDLRVVASLTFLLGLTWILSFGAWGPAKTPLLYLFSLLNSLQGFFIFLLYCLMKENVRKQWRIHLRCGRFRQTEYSGLAHLNNTSVLILNLWKSSNTSNSGTSHDGVFPHTGQKNNKIKCVFNFLCVYVKGRLWKFPAEKFFFLL